MAYCTNCGTELENGAQHCPFCGAAQGPSNVTYSSAPTPAPAPKDEDTGNILYGLLGCCVPIVGLILFLVWKDTQPKNAKTAGIGALISVICVVVFYVLVIVIGVGLSVATYTY